MQDCLNRVLALQLPVSGAMDPPTRSAIRSFQRQQGLAVTGVVGPETQEALTSACEGGQGGQGGSPPDAADAGSGELGPAFGFGSASTQREEELKISAPYEVLLTPGPLVGIPNRASLEQLPRRRGIYFIHVGDALWYIGKADSIRERFQDRFKTFHDFRIPPETYLPLLQRIRVSWYLLGIKGPEGARGIHSRPQRSSQPWKPVSYKPQALLRAVEQHFIKKLAPRGNESKECVRFEGTGALRISYADGRSPEMMSSVFC